jgi:DNA-binding transcriptional regulator YhcF (GntR family)
MKNRGIPKYVLLREEIRQMIEGGALQPGDLLESESSLIKSRGMSKATVRQAILDLVHEGLLERKQGVGTIVLPPKHLSGTSVGFVYASEHHRTHDIFLSQILLGLGKYLALDNSDLVIKGSLPEAGDRTFFDKLSCLIFYEEISEENRSVLDSLDKPYILFNPTERPQTGQDQVLDFDNAAMERLVDKYVARYAKPDSCLFVFPSKRHNSFNERYQAVEAAAGRHGFTLESSTFRENEIDGLCRRILDRDVSLLCFGNDFTGHQFYRAVRKAHPTGELTREQLFHLSGLPGLGFDGTDVYYFGNQLAGTVKIDLFKVGRFLGKAIVKSQEDKSAPYHERIPVEPVIY